jgi:hypothetical protein
MTTSVIRIILNQGSCSHNASNFGRSDHGVRPRHLPYGMRKKQNLLPCCLANAVYDFRIAHDTYQCNEFKTLLQAKEHWLAGAKDGFVFQCGRKVRRPRSVFSKGRRRVYTDRLR